MKTKMFWFIAVLGIAMTTLSCQKEPEIDPVVIDSEVLDSGISDKVTATTGTNGTTLSYESWIEVLQKFGPPPAPAPKSAGMTRSSTGSNGGTKFSVTLKNVLSDINEEIVYDYPGFDNPTTSISYKIGDSYKDGFVTVYDSMLVYTVTYHDFSFDYELPYQVPVYNDGVTIQMMPYYRYGNITSGETTTTDGDSRVIEGRVYAVKNLRHSIEIEFHGKMYAVKANITLLRRMGDAGQPYIVRSEVSEQNIVPLSNGDGFSSNLAVKQTWSNGRVEINWHNADLLIDIPYYTMDDEVVIRENPNLLKLRDIYVENDTRDYHNKNDYIKIHNIGDKVILEYNFFNAFIPVRRMEAYYDDAVLQTKLPGYEINPSKVTILSQDFIFQETDGTRTWYRFEVTIRIEIGELSFEGTYFRSVVFYD